MNRATILGGQDRIGGDAITTVMVPSSTHTRRTPGCASPNPDHRPGDQASDRLAGRVPVAPTTKVMCLRITADPP